MANLPTTLPSEFKAAYTSLASSRGSNFCRRHLAGLLAALLVSWARTRDQIGSPNGIIPTNFLNTDSAKQNAFIVKKLDRPLSSRRRRAFMEEAFKRILAFNPRSGQLEPHIKSSDLDAKDAARSRILLRLALRAPRSSDLYKSAFHLVLQNVCIFSLSFFSFYSSSV